MPINMLVKHSILRNRAHVRSMWQWGSSFCNAMVFVMFLGSATNAVAQTIPDRSAIGDERQTAVLSGTVRSEDGSPLADAAIVVESGLPRSDMALLTSRCYPDCLKSCFTDEAGKFAIQELDDRLLYRLRIGKQGYESKLLADVDPQHGDIAIRLSPARFFSADSGVATFKWTSNGRG